MSFFYKREENEKEIKIVFTTTPWQWYINVFFVVFISIIRFWDAYKQYTHIQEQIIDEKFFLFIFILIGTWFAIVIPLSIGNHKAAKEVNRAVAEGKNIQSSGNAWSIKTPRTVIISK